MSHSVSFAEGDRVTITFVENMNVGEEGRLLSYKWRDPWAVPGKGGQQAPTGDYSEVLVLPFVGVETPAGMMEKLTSRDYVWPDGRWPQWRAVKERSNLIFLKSWLGKSTEGIYRVASNRQDFHVSCPVYREHLEYVCKLLPALKTVLEIELGPQRQGKGFADCLTPGIAARLLEKHRAGQLSFWWRGLPRPPHDDYFDFDFLSNVASLIDHGHIPSR